LVDQYLSVLERIWVNLNLLMIEHPLSNMRNWNSGIFLKNLFSLPKKVSCKQRISGWLSCRQENFNICLWLGAIQIICETFLTLFWKGEINNQKSTLTSLILLSNKTSTSKSNKTVFKKAKKTKQSYTLSLKFRVLFEWCIKPLNSS